MSKTQESFVGLWDHSTSSLLWSIPSTKFDSIIDIFIRYADDPKIRPVWVRHIHWPSGRTTTTVFCYLSGYVIKQKYQTRPLPTPYKCMTTLDYRNYAKTHHIPICHPLIIWNATLDSMIRLIGDIQKVGDDYYSNGKVIAFRIGG